MLKENQKNAVIGTSRRDFIYQSSLAVIGVLASGKVAYANSPTWIKGSGFSKIKGVQVGEITYSFRGMPDSPADLIKYCLEANISDIELMGDSIEIYAGAPKNPISYGSYRRREWTDEMKAQATAYKEALTNWRQTASMEKFKEVHDLFKKAGINIYAYKPNALGTSNTDAEIIFALKSAKTLGANSVTVELPEDASHTQRLGDLGEKYGIYIGYHAHLQATDTAWDEALGQSSFNTMNLDCGHYIAVGGDNTKESLLALIEAKHDRISSMHIKDRKNKEGEGKNMPWGQGDTPLKEILTLLKTKKYPIPATIEMEYTVPEGSNAVVETGKCWKYAKAILEG